MSTTLEKAMREVPGGPMSAAEIRFCQQARQGLREASEGTAPFLAVITNLRADLVHLATFAFDVDAATAAGFRPAVAVSPALGPRAPLTPSERSFLLDLEGFLDFALRNGLSFLSVLTVLRHDITGIAPYGFNLNRAESEGFIPKSSGWSARNASSPGDLDDVTE